MQITADTVVSFHYVLRDEHGVMLESSRDDEPVIYLHGHANILPALEAALVGHAVADHVRITLTPAEAYGNRRPDAVARVSLKHVRGPRRLQPGMVVAVQTAKGEIRATVLKVGKFNVDVDTNHPFAGRTLDFEIDVVGVRAASDEEIAHGHAHGSGGHQH